MTTYQGIEVEIDKAISQGNDRSTEIDSGLYSFMKDQFGLSISSHSLLKETWKTVEGIYHDWSTPELILERVYLIPREIDAQFIASPKIYQITIWNAKSIESANITEINDVDYEGTLLEHQSLPIFLAPESEKYNTLTVLLEGPAIQDTKYIYVIDGFDYDLLITGQRIEVWLYEPDWSDGVKFGNNFLTVLSNSNKFYEQRRSLFSNSIREQSANFLFDGDNAREALNEIRRFKSLIMVPIFSELLTLSASAEESDSTVYLAESIAKYWNLMERAEYILIKSRDDIDKFDLRRINAISESFNSIALDNGVSQSFSVADTVIYPVFIATIADFRPEFITDDIFRFAMTAQEFNDGR